MKSYILYWNTTHILLVKHLFFINEYCHSYTSMQLKSFKIKNATIKLRRIITDFTRVSRRVLVSLFCSVEQVFYCDVSRPTTISWASFYSNVADLESTLYWSTKIVKEIKCGINSFHLVRARSFVLDIYLRQKNLDLM